MGNLVGPGTRGYQRRSNAFEPTYWTQPVSLTVSNLSDYSWGAQTVIWTSTSEDLVLLGIQETQPTTQAFLSYQVWTGTKILLGSVVKAIYDSTGNMYVLNASTTNAICGILKLAPDRTMTLLAGQGSNASVIDGTGSGARFNAPNSMTMGLDGSIYLTDGAFIRKVTTAGVVTSIAGSGTGNTNGTGTGAAFNGPFGITTHPSTGDLYVADTGNGNVRKVTTGGVVTTFATTGGSPGDLVWDSTGTYLYVTDYFNHVVYRITAAGTVTTWAGQTGTAGSSNGTGTGAQFYSPYGIAIDSTNTFLYVKDRGTGSGSHALRRIATSNAAVTQFAGNVGLLGNAEGQGVVGASFANASATFGGLGWDINGNLVYADTGGYRVKRISMDQRIITILGMDTGNGGATTFPITPEYRIAQTSRTWSTSVGYGLWNPFPAPVRVPAGSRIALTGNNNTTTSGSATVSLVYAPASMYV